MKKVKRIGKWSLQIALFSWLILLVCTLSSWAFDPTSRWFTLFIMVAFLSAIGSLLAIGFGIASLWKRNDIGMAVSGVVLSMPLILFFTYGYILMM